MCAIQPIESGVPQDLPVSLFFFIIYLGEILKTIEQAIPGIRILLYTDNIYMLISASSVQQACQVLEQAVRIATIRLPLRCGDNNQQQSATNPSPACRPHLVSLGVKWTYYVCCC
jgi:hypothetical protein